MPYMLPLLNMQAAAPPPQSGSSSRKPPQHQQTTMMRTVSISILVMSLPVLYVSFLHVPPAALFRDTVFWFLMSNSIIIVIAADSGMLFFRSSSSDDDGAGGSLPFDVGEHAAVKHVATDDIVSAVVADDVVLPVENNQVMVLSEQDDDVTMPVVAENGDHAYALVLSEPVPDESRDITVVTPAQPSTDLAAGDAVSVWNEAAAAGAMVRRATNCRPGLTASRSLAREERSTRRRRQRHSRALVPVQDKSVVMVAEEKKLRRTVTEGSRPPPDAEAEEMEKESEYSRLSDEELNRRVEEFITKFNREIRLQQEMEQLALAAA